MPSIYTPSVSFTRPTDTTAYAEGDLVANSTTAASVVVPTWNTSSPSGAFKIMGVRLLKSTALVTNAQFRVHLYSAIPTIATAGDNSAFASNVSGRAGWLGSFDGTMVASHADGCGVVCLPTLQVPSRVAEAAALFGLVVALAAYAPGSGEVFTVVPLLEQL